MISSLHPKELGQAAGQERRRFPVMLNLPYYFSDIVHPVSFLQPAKIREGHLFKDFF